MALGVRNSLGNAGVFPCAGCVRNLLCALLLDCAAGCVRNLLCTSFRGKAAGCIRNLLCNGVWNLAAGCVRNLAVADFRNHCCAANLLLNSAWHPSLAADCLARSWAADLLHAAWVAWIGNALFNHWAGNRLCIGFPATTLHINGAICGDRLHDGVAHVAIAGLGFCTVLSTANVTIARFVAWLADVIAHLTVARFVYRLAHRVTNVAIAGVVDRLANVAADGFPAGRNDWLAYLMLHTLVFRFVNRLAYGIALISVVRFVNISCARNRNSLRTLIIDRLHAGILLLVPHDISHRSVLSATSHLRCCEVATLVARFRCAT